MKCSEYHKKLGPDGVGQCSVPTWDEKGNECFCEAPAYGFQTEEGMRRYRGYVPFLACWHHGGPKRPVAGIGDGK